MKRKKPAALAIAWAVLCSMFAVPAQTAAADISDDDLEDVIAIHTYLLGLLKGPEAADINEDDCINAVDLSLIKRDLLGYTPPALKPLRADTWDIYLNEEKTVTFTVQTVSISDPVTLYDEAGNVIAEMHDNGENGDEMPGDSIYTAQAVLSSDTIRNAGYYAAAGELRSEPFEICFYRELEDEEIEGFLTMFEQLSEMSYEGAAEFITQSDEISAYTLDEEQKQIWFQTVCGIHCCFQEPQESDVQTLGIGSRAIPDGREYDYEEVSAAIASNTFTPAHPDKKDVIVLRPFKKDIDKYSIPASAFSEYGELLANALGSDLTEVDDTDVTLDLLKNLDAYGTVLLNTHGLVSELFYNSYIVTGDDADKMYSTLDPKYYTDLVESTADAVSGRICYCFIGNNYRVAVSGKFFDKYYEPGSLDQSFWYLGNCNSMYDNSIADVLLSKGAGAVVGYSNTVESHYCFRTCFETVINSMILSSDTVRNGVFEAKRLYGYNDPKFAVTELRYRGLPHYRLVKGNDEAGSSGIYSQDGHHYQIFHNHVKWSVAKTYCEMNNGHLATITSAKEEQFIEKIINDYNHSDFYWLGATDEEEEGVWKWVTGEEFTYQNWSYGNPNNFDHDEYGFEHYLGITGKGYFFADPFEWNDFADATYDGVFDYKTGFICEWDY